MPSLHESALDVTVQCPMFQELKPDYMARPALETLRWAVRERHGGKVRTAPEIRERFVKLWKENWPGAQDGKEYWEGPRAAAGLGRRLHEFLLKYRILHPFEPYEIKLPEGTVTGNSALAVWDKHGGEEVPMVLDVDLRRPRDTRVPKYSALAKWLAEREKSESVELGIIHLALVWGEPRITKNVSETLARRWIGGILKQTVSSPFPRPCTLCPNCAHPCKEIHRGQDDHHWD